MQEEKTKGEHSKDKVIRSSTISEENGSDISLDNRRMEELNTYRYFRTDIMNDVRMMEVIHRIRNDRKIVGALLCLLNR